MIHLDKVAVQIVAGLEEFDGQKRTVLSRERAITFVIKKLQRSWDNYGDPKPHTKKDKA